MIYGFGRLAMLLTSFALINNCISSPAQQPLSKLRSDRFAAKESAVEAAYKAYLRAWKDKNYVALDRLLSDDYKAVNFRGFVSTKANEIATAKEDHDYSAMDGKVMSVTIFGDSAVVSGLIDARWKDEQGKMQLLTFRFLAMLQRQKGDWRLVATQSSRFNKPGNG
jgi:ketosteroid isomerase-like protein